MLTLFTTHLLSQSLSVNKTQPQNFDVQYFNDGKSANVSWSLSESATKYYLHVNSTNKKYLFWFGEDVSV